MDTLAEGRRAEGLLPSRASIRLSPKRWNRLGLSCARRASRRRAWIIAAEEAKAGLSMPPRRWLSSGVPTAGAGDAAGSRWRASICLKGAGVAGTAKARVVVSYNDPGT